MQCKQCNQFIERCYSISDFFISLILMVMFIMVITLEVTSMITCGQMVSTMTEICSTRDVSPVSLATRASGNFT